MMTNSKHQLNLRVSLPALSPSSSFSSLPSPALALRTSYQPSLTSPSLRHAPQQECHGCHRYPEHGVYETGDDKEAEWSHEYFSRHDCLSKTERSMTTLMNVVKLGLLDVFPHPAVSYFSAYECWQGDK